MLNLEGQIAVLYQEGKQVAGMYDWEIHVILDYTTKDGMKEYKPHKNISARSYWLVEPVKENVFYAEFYQTMLDNLILMDAGNVAIDFPDCATLDKRLYAPINVNWVGDNDH
uniref:Uncharacterized protein n=1 Tax=viral metagenome TaxID=1070528 RepID=A0A6M3IWT7_9ZZZZ